ncbi:hypothetical protein L210DRAFT_989482 [Boletus edulis BED1]|uniref:Uncharacterized protein n=1 Tax=Boletus edulis BED1 TaxID=1328754 RepID=A0AAD4GGL4_BOLED|nr:hypothetical protein L210DRAFT_989482 [Boletus edulis BED1]
MACQVHKHAHTALIVLQIGVACDLIDVTLKPPSHHPTTTCAVSTIAHISPSTDCLEPDHSFPSSLFQVQSLVYRRLWIVYRRLWIVYRRLWIVSSSTTPLYHFEHDHSSFAGYGLSRARLLVPFPSVPF